MNTAIYIGGVIFWLVVIFAILWLLGEILFGFAVALDYTRWRISLQARKPTAWVTFRAAVGLWPRFIGFRKGHSSYQTGAYEWHGFGDWRVAKWPE